MPQPHFESEQYRIPLAYLITFRSYGTWLHDDPADRSIVFTMFMERLDCRR